MSILFLTAPSPDYGADYLLHGFAHAGLGVVVEYPRKAAVHWHEEPVFDCHMNLDGLTEEWPMDRIQDGLAECEFDCIVVSTVRPPVPTILHGWRASGLLKRNLDRLVIYDAEDRWDADFRTEVFGWCGGWVAAFFKREVRPGQDGVRPLLFGYPKERVVSVGERDPAVVYSAYLWDWTAERGLRGQLRDALQKESQAMIFGDVPGRRVPVTESHAWNRRASVAVSPAGNGWCTNRHLEVIADGCAPVIETPTVLFPDALSADAARYFESVDGAMTAVRELLHEPAVARQVAERAQEELCAAHTTVHRAHTVWDVVRGNVV